MIPAWTYSRLAKYDTGRSQNNKEIALVCTPYCAVPAQELVEYALELRDNRTDLEIELAQRLQLALDMLIEAEQFHPRPERTRHDA